MNRRSWLKLAGCTAAVTATAEGWVAHGAAPDPLGTDGGHINLAGNENPFGPSPAVVRAIVAAAPFACRYPFREEQALKDLLAEKEGVGTENIVLGNGCDELLALAATAFLDAKRSLVAAEPTYFQLIDYAKKLGAEIRGIPVRSGMQHDLRRMEQAVDNSPGLVYLCNPDNPSGTQCEAGHIEGFCREVAPRCPVFVDEVYLELSEAFAAETQVKLVREGLPVMVGRSFSKMYGLAGQRIGYVVTTAPLAQELSKWMMSSVNYLGVAAARAALGDSGFSNWSVRKIRDGRSRLYAVLDELGLEYIPSVGNFVFHRIGAYRVQEYQAAMKARGLLVGWPHEPARGYEGWCRTSIGTEREMALCHAAMREVLRTTG
ncbi:MAG TPA: histidinol-phosphate transaminase [Opitutaceae bacterium]|nr:histidinol-phosphate transaminase [Opitutaceae bacterium]